MTDRKRAYRLYKLEGLDLRSKRPRRHVRAVPRERGPVAIAANDRGRRILSSTLCSTANASAL
jgi:hypothetical protein